MDGLNCAPGLTTWLETLTISMPSDGGGGVAVGRVGIGVGLGSPQSALASLAADRIQNKPASTEVIFSSIIVPSAKCSVPKFGIEISSPKEEGE